MTEPSKTASVASPHLATTSSIDDATPYFNGGNNIQVVLKKLSSATIMPPSGQSSNDATPVTIMVGLEKIPEIQESGHVTLKK